MRIVVRAYPDQERLRAAFRRFFRPYLRVVRGTGFAVALASAVNAVTLVSTVDAPLGVLLSIVGVVLGLLIAALPRWGVRRALRTSWAMLGRPTTYEITEDGIRADNDLVESMTRWSAVRTTVWMRDQILFVVSVVTFLPVPTRGLPPEALADLEQFLRGKGLVSRRPAPSRR